MSGVAGCTATSNLQERRFTRASGFYDAVHHARRTQAWRDCGAVRNYRWSGVEILVSAGKPRVGTERDFETALISITRNKSMESSVIYCMSYPPSAEAQAAVDSAYKRKLPKKKPCCDEYLIPAVVVLAVVYIIVRTWCLM